MASRARTHDCPPLAAEGGPPRRSRPAPHPAAAGRSVAPRRVYRAAPAPAPPQPRADPDPGPGDAVRDRVSINRRNIARRARFEVTGNARLSVRARAGPPAIRLALFRSRAASAVRRISRLGTPEIASAAPSGSARPVVRTDPPGAARRSRRQGRSRSPSRAGRSRARDVLGFSRPCLWRGGGAFPNRRFPNRHSSSRYVHEEISTMPGACRERHARLSTDLARPLARLA